MTANPKAESQVNVAQALEQYKGDQYGIGANYKDLYNADAALKRSFTGEHVVSPEDPLVLGLQSLAVEKAPAPVVSAQIASPQLEAPTQKTSRQWFSFLDVLAKQNARQAADNKQKLDNTSKLKK